MREAGKVLDEATGRQGVAYWNNANSWPVVKAGFEKAIELARAESQKSVIASQELVA